MKTCDWAWLIVTTMGFSSFANAATLISSDVHHALLKESPQAAQNIIKIQNKDKSALAQLQIPLSFEVNKGQADRSVRYLSRGPGYGIFLRQHDAIFVLNKPAIFNSAYKAGAPRHPQIIQMHFAGANPESAPQGEVKLPGKSNYLIGKTSKNWHLGAAQYAHVHYPNLYHGVDLVFYGKQNKMEYDFIVAPHADPEQIRVNFDGAKHVQISKTGDLLLDTGKGVIRQHKPLIYQEANGKIQVIDGRYQFKGNGDIGFKIAHYDPSRALIIDPVLEYSSYYGGSGIDVPEGLAVDAQGNAYITGYTSSTDLPLTNALQGSKAGGSYDIFITKFNTQTNQIIYSTYLGGGGDDEALDLAIDGTGAVYLTGWTNSANFPLSSNPAQASYGGATDAFVAKLNPQGNGLDFSTFLGGSSDDEGYGITVDGAGISYVTGKTSSSQFPILNALQANYGGGTSDAFITRLDSSGQILSSSYFGGSGAEEGHHLALDGNGNLFMDGKTSSFDFPLQNPTQANFGGGSADAFISKLNNNVSTLLYSSYFGGSGNDVADGLAVDPSGNVYMSGETSSTNFPLAPNGQGTVQSTYGGGISDAFISKLSNTGALIYSTYLGGGGEDHAHTLAVDASGRVYTTGHTDDWAHFPQKGVLTTVNGQPVASVPSTVELTIIRLNADGTLDSSTAMGGNGTDHGHRIALYTENNVIKAIIAGHSDSTNFPTTSNALQPLNHGQHDTILLKVAFPDSLSTTSTPGATTPNNAPATTSGNSPAASNGGGGGGGCAIASHSAGFDPVLLSLLMISGLYILRRQLGKRKSAVAKKGK